MPTLRTLILRPGQLSLDFIEGRGVVHTHPVRLFLVAGGLAFLASTWSRGLLFPGGRGPGG